MSPSFLSLSCFLRPFSIRITNLFLSFSLFSFTHKSQCLSPYQSWLGLFLSIITVLMAASPCLSTHSLPSLDPLTSFASFPPLSSMLLALIPLLYLSPIFSRTTNPNQPPIWYPFFFLFISTFFPFHK